MDIKDNPQARLEQPQNLADFAAANEAVVREVLKRMNGSVNGHGLEEFEEMPNSGIGEFRELVVLLAARWRFMLLTAVAGATVAALIAFAIPNTYTAKALIMTPSKPQSLSAALMGPLMGLAGAAGSSIGLGLKDPNDVYIGILRSSTVTNDLVAQFKLREVYSVKTNEDACRELLDRTSLTSGRDSLIRINVDDHDPQRAAALANAYVAELEKQNNRLAITESGQRRRFFEQEVEAEKNAVAQAELTLKETQQKTGLVAVSNQAQVVITSIARLRADIAVQEVSLQRLQMAATAENPEVARQQTTLTGLRAQLAKLEAGSARQQSGDPLVPVANVPQAGLEYLRALRDVKYHENLFEVLAKQYEAAKIDEAKEAPVIQVVDQASRPERKSSPHRGQVTLLGAALAAIGGAVFIRFARDKRRA